MTATSTLTQLLNYDERERERVTDRQTDRQTETETDTERERQRQRETHRETYIHAANRNTTFRLSSAGVLKKEGEKKRRELGEKRLTQTLRSPLTSPKHKGDCRVSAPVDLAICFADVGPIPTNLRSLRGSALCVSHRFQSQSRG